MLACVFLYFSNYDTEAVLMAVGITAVRY